ncbi:MAG: phosphoenolpyruvate--protein phosphotransferase [Aggregatilineales bacterium]|nr:phosphoenolpyruvate--protein phosphotransferase [Aggregatilineales bacterium]
MNEITYRGIAAAEGIASGPAFRFEPPQLTITRRTASDPAAEMERFTAARETAQAEVQALREQVEAQIDAEHAAIFDAHIMLLNDPTLEQNVRSRIEGGASAELAVQEATEEIASVFAAMEDEMFAARAADVMDLGRRMLRILLGVPDTSLEALTTPSIIVAHDLAPSDTAGLDPAVALGICTAAGGLTSHTAILARTLGIPAVVGLGSDVLAQVTDNALLVVDGSAGEVVLNPTPETLARYQAAQAEQQARMAKIKAAAQEQAHTQDGRRVEVGANIGDVESARDALNFGAEGVGLLRTEFLYLQHTRPPTEDEQVRVYREIFEVFGERPVIVRTLDIGGDKPPSYIDFEDELNPFLGWRAIRIGFDRPELLKTQLRAILRAASGYNARIMYPMIAGLEDLRRANEILDEARRELEAEGREYARDVPVGIMVETPAAAVLADLLATEADFFSIGTNDLTQYALAVDRTNERVAYLYQPLHPAALRLIKQTIDAAHALGKWVGMCGELAGMRRAIPILLGLGLDEFSMTPRAIPEAKWLISQFTVEEAGAVARNALSLPTADEVVRYMDHVLEDIGA